MTGGKEILMDDLPPEIMDKQASHRSSDAAVNISEDWVASFEIWLDKELSEGKSEIIKEAQSAFERSLIEIALKHTRGHKQEAAKRIGWGRNTITRKMQELDMG